MKWVPLLVISSGTGICAELVVAFAVTVVFVKQIRSTTSFLVTSGSRVNQTFFLGMVAMRVRTWFDADTLSS